MNWNVTTELCEIMHRHGTDKSMGHHNYTVLYESLFSEMKNEKINLLEIGIGSINPKIPSNMGVDGIVGASLRGWKEYFPNGMIYGADIDHDCLFEEDRIKTIYCDQTSEISLKLMVKELNVKFDIILDDGYQNFYANYNSLIHTIKFLKPNGFYIIEDIKTSDLPNYSPERLEYIKSHFDLTSIELIEPPHPQNTHDNRLLVIRK